MSHGRQARAASSPQSCAVRAKPADGIFANPADRPEGPDGQSRAVATASSRVVAPHTWPSPPPPRVSALTGHNDPSVLISTATRLLPTTVPPAVPAA